MKTMLLVFLLGAVSTEALAQRINVPPSEREVLDNGLTLILMPYAKVPVVHFRLMVRGGSALDPEGEPGVASMMASLLREGTTSRSATAIAEEIDFIGGSLSTGAGLDYCAVTMEVLSKDLETGLDLFADVILHPSFPGEELERERKQRLARLEGLKEEPSAIASRVFTRVVYGDHPYGRETEGSVESLGRMTREQIVESYRNRFVPGNALLVVVGEFPLDETRAKLRSAFAGWAQGSVAAASLPEPVPRTGKTVVVVNKPDATQTQIRIGSTGLRANDPDQFPALVANTVFGSGFTSRLVEELRVKRSLTYGVSSGFPSSLAGGTFVISTFTKTETTSEMLDALLEQLSLYRATGPDDQEVQKAKNYLTGSFARGLQTPGALAARLTDRELYGFPDDYLETYIERIRDTTREDIMRVIRERFPEENLLTVLVMPYQNEGDLPERYRPDEVFSLDEAIR